MSAEDEVAQFETRRQLVQMQMLYEVGIALSESLDPQVVAQEILQRALAMVDAGCGLLLMRTDTGALESAADIGVTPGEIEAILRLDELESARQERKTIQWKRSAHKPRCLCVVPLQHHQQVSGLLIVGDKETRGADTGPFDEGDISLLHSLALQAGAALHNASLHRNLEDAYKQLKAAQAKIAQLEQLRALGDLAADVTHAMSHVLGVIIGRADLFLHHGKDPGTTVAAIATAAEGGQEIVDRIKKVTRLGVGEDRSLETIDELAAQALADVKLLSHVDVAWHARFGGPDEHLVNAVDIREAIANLLLNAAEAVGNGGRVELTTRFENGAVAIGVRDDGPGMADEIRARVFEPFFTTKDTAGAGLGLSIVYRIAEAHGGSVDVESLPGQGATFTLTLPRTSL